MSELYNIEGGPSDGVQIPVQDGIERMVIPGLPQYAAEYKGESRVYYTHYIYEIDRKNKTLIFSKKDQPNKI